MASPEWCLIESDPGVFSELVDNLGTEGVEFEEVYSIDDIQQVPGYLRNDPTARFRCRKAGEWKRSDSTSVSAGVEDGGGEKTAGAQVERQEVTKTGAAEAEVEREEPEGGERKIYGLVFLFKWKSDKEKAQPAQDFPEICCPEEPTLFFAKQVIPNACATQAILSILFNTVPRAQLSQPLRELMEFSIEFDPSMKGLAISNSDILRQTHNSFKAPASFATENADDDDSDEASFHFVSYICFEGARCYEIDGLKPSPKFLGEVKKGRAWTDVVVPSIRDRINRLQDGRDGSEIRFNLLACVEKPLDLIKNEMLRCRHLRQRAGIKLLSFGDRYGDLEIDAELDDSLAPDSCPTMEALPDDEAALNRAAEVADAQINILKEAEASEVAKRQKWTKENQRRRHTLAPFILCALRHLARRGELRTAYAEALTKAQ
eukprot:GHVS01029654.1.p1 GENE.GHVS01029654.1~~GHVS01029654.1.p1  ORF type:complete len:432 (+),score=62.37 GHVS01029654.1:35-1330(+)